MDTNINSVLDLVGHPTADAVPWREARDGDLVIVRDPGARVHGPLYRIDGAPSFRDDATLSVHALCVSQGTYRDIDTLPGSVRREFASAAWQVWRTDWS